MKRLVAASVAAFALSAGAAHAADLAIRIEGVRSDAGEIRVALFDSAETWSDGDRAVREITVKAARGTVETVVRDLPPGTYAIGGFHDENGNGEFDRNLLGIPREGFFVSKIAGMVLSTPSFDDVAFRVPPEGASVTLRMRYY